MLFAALILIFALAGGCSSGKHIQTADPGVNKVQFPENTRGFSFPAPSALVEQDAEPRNTAYVESDLVKDAADCNPAMPWNNIAPVGTSVVYSPDWTAASGDSSGLAYCIWEFSISGYDRNNQVRYTWDSPLADPAEGWIGLANWGADSWDWFVGEADGKLDVESLAPYFNGSDTLLLIVLRIGTAASTLNEVRIGGIPPFAELTTSHTKGLVPLNVDFDGSGSLDDDGVILKYEWDFNGDGTFETDSGSEALQSHSYSSSMQAIAAMRVTDDDGLTATDSVLIIAAEPEAHTWGGSDTETILDFAVTSTNLYCVGYSGTYVGDNSESLILLKYTLTGELVWAKAFYGNDNEIGYAVGVDSDGNIITAGRSSSWGAGGTDMLVQKWSPDGSLLWSRVFGGSGTDHVYALAINGPDIYLAGYTSTEDYSAGQEDALFVRIDTDGDVQWATTWGGAERDYARDIKHVPLLGGLHCFRITGDTRSFGEGNADVIYLTIWDAGNISEQYTWGDSSEQVGSAIRVGYLGADPYICGFTRQGPDKKVLLLEFSLEETFARKRWTRAGIHEAFDIVYSGDKLYLVGRYREESASVPVGILMIVDDTTWNITSMHYTNQTLGVAFNKLALFAGTAAAFICGDMDDADGSLSNTYNDPAADALDFPWQEAAGTTSSISIGSEATNGGYVQDITTAVIDTGGGGRDAAIALLKIS